MGIVVIIILIILIGGFFLFNSNNPNKESCVKEGESGNARTYSIKKCCQGLTEIKLDSPINGECEKVMDGFGCTKCGDGICGKGENYCNCPGDCKTEPNNSLWLNDMIKKESNLKMVEECNYDNKKVYYFIHGCCDFFDQVYTENGVKICSFGGFTGRGEGNCSGFDKNTCKIYLNNTGNLYNNLNSNYIKPNQNVTLNDLKNNNITNYVSVKTNIITKVNWEYCSLAHIPENPEPPADTVKKICGQLTVNSKDLNYPVKGLSNGGDFYVISNNLTKLNDSNGYEIYSFDGVKFSKTQTYILTGFLKYRGPYYNNSTILSDPKFIEQSNNPNYWSQTFEFEIIDVKKY